MLLYHIHLHYTTPHYLVYVNHFRRTITNLHNLILSTSPPPPPTPKFPPYLEHSPRPRLVPVQLDTYPTLPYIPPSVFRFFPCSCEVRMYVSPLRRFWGIRSLEVDFCSGAIPERNGLERFPSPVCLSRGLVQFFLGEREVGSADFGSCAGLVCYHQSAP